MKFCDARCVLFSISLNWKCRLCLIRINAEKRPRYFRIEHNHRIEFSPTQWTPTAADVASQARANEEDEEKKQLEIQSTDFALWRQTNAKPKINSNLLTRMNERNWNESHARRVQQRNFRFIHSMRILFSIFFSCCFTSPNTRKWAPRIDEMQNVARFSLLSLLKMYVCVCVSLKLALITHFILCFRLSD